MSNDYKSILDRLLDNVDDTLDKRQGSIIYDALAPAAMELAQCYVSLEIYKEQTYLKTATGENLDNRVADYGLTREEATYAIRIITVVNTENEPMDVEIGTRFSVPTEDGGYNYEVIEQIETGRFKARCETIGTVGNEYLGILLPLYNITDLGEANMVGTFEPAQDAETDESLRKRAIDKLNKEPFGGNMADYELYMESIDGVGASKIFPVWNGGGTVKVSFVTSDYDIPTVEFINTVQNLIDPIPNHAEGLGMAPIGHTVTVVAPTLVNVSIEAKLLLVDSYTILNVQDLVEEAVKSYIKEVQSNWASSSTTLTIYTSRLISSILSVEGIADVSQIKINGSTNNLILTQNATLQQFPKFSEINLTEA